MPKRRAGSNPVPGTKVNSHAVQLAFLPDCPTLLQRCGSRVLLRSRVPEAPFCKPHFRVRLALYRSCRIRQRWFVAADRLHAAELYSWIWSKNVPQMTRRLAVPVLHMLSEPTHPKSICMQLPNSPFSSCSLSVHGYRFVSFAIFFGRSEWLKREPSTALGSDAQKGRFKSCSGHHREPMLDGKRECGGLLGQSPAAKAGPL
jgi:hypothetical protein